MPELPEVETVRAGIEQDLIDRTIQSVTLNRPNLRVPFPEKLHETMKNATLRKAARRAKYLILTFDNEQSLIIHLGMSGKILIISGAQTYEPQKHDHMIIAFVDGYKMIFNDARRFGMVYMCHANELNTHKAFIHLGPEPLSNHFHAEYLFEKLSKRKTAIKQVMMDQRIVVGIGNIYINEALFQTGIHPERAANNLSRNEIEDLVAASKDILRTAITKGGSTLKDYQTTSGDLGYFQHQFAVYNKEKQSCPGCSCDINKTQGIKRIVQGGRSTFYCPEKQN